MLSIHKKKKVAGVTIAVISFDMLSYCTTEIKGNFRILMRYIVFGKTKCLIREKGPNRDGDMRKSKLIL